MLRDTLSGVSAGVCIALGGSVFLAVDNRVAGAVLFSVALLCICMKGYALFTGKVGFLPEDRSKAAVQLLLDWRCALPSRPMPRPPGRSAKPSSAWPPPPCWCAASSAGF